MLMGIKVLCNFINFMLFLVGKRSGAIDDCTCINDLLPFLNNDIS